MAKAFLYFVTSGKTMIIETGGMIFLGSKQWILE